jgi:hypothetical protein
MRLSDWRDGRESRQLAARTVMQLQQPSLGQICGQAHAN